MRREQVIVLVHADDAMRVTYEVVLKHEGWTVLGASNSSAALELIRENRPALVIVDTRLPRDSASRVIRTLRSEGSKVRILALCDATVCDEVKALGADEVRPQPIEAAHLVKAVRQIAGRG